MTSLSQPLSFSLHLFFKVFMPQYNVSVAYWRFIREMKYNNWFSSQKGIWIRILQPTYWILLSINTRICIACWTLERLCHNFACLYTPILHFNNLERLF